MKKIKYTFILAAGMLFMFSACEYKFIEPKDPDIDPTDSISFSAEIIPIFEDKCNSCHSDASIAFSLEAGQAYNNIVDLGLINPENPNQSLIYSVAEPNASHGAVYSVNDAAKVLQWIEQGAENN